jgi:hypothetical protein
MHFLHLYDCGTLKPVKVALGSDNGRNDANFIVCIHGNVTANPAVQLLFTNKMLKINKQKALGPTLLRPYPKSRVGC